ncbi:MAG: hypothetical protein N3F11_09135 [Casimicrobiaceae bacterium]|nr:hypothetical protein [Casimicrobiaceae bacterium]MDW8311440.1 hypothetical protein [Burkholderiales bacterium]
MMKRALVALAAFLTGAGAQAACYSVYEDDRLVFRSATPPVDLSRPIGAQVRAIWPRGHLIIAPSHPLCFETHGRTQDDSIVALASPERATPPAKADSTASQPASRARGRGRREPAS